VEHLNRVVSRTGLVLLAASLVLGCVGAREEPTRSLRIGMTCMDLTNPFFKLICNVMKDEASVHGYEVVCLDGGNDAARQNNQLSDFVAQRYGAIFLNAADSRAAAEGVGRAHAAGIPVFTFDVQMTDEAAQELVVAHIGSDNYQGGRLAAESMMEAAGDQGRIAIVAYPEINSARLRVKGFRDYLRENDSRLEIVTELNGKGNRNDGYATATDILQAHPDIVGLFAINDPSALGAHAAIAKAGRQDEITLIGFDASPAGKQAVFEKKLYDTPQQFPRKMAKGTVDLLVRYLEGEPIEPRTLIPCAHYRYEDSVEDESRIQEQW
jgi:ribose transport system substrate-binding protein